MTPLQGARRVVKQNISELQISISEDFRFELRSARRGRGLLFQLSIAVIIIIIIESNKQLQIL